MTFILFFLVLQIIHVHGRQLEIQKKEKVTITHNPHPPKVIITSILMYLHPGYTLFIFFIIIVIVSSGQQRDSVIHIYIYPLPLKLPFHPGCHITPSRVLHSRTLSVIRFKYSSVYLLIPDSLTILSPQRPPSNCKFLL